MVWGMLFLDRTGACKNTGMCMRLKPFTSTLMGPMMAHTAPGSFLYSRTMSCASLDGRVTESLSMRWTLALLKFATTPRWEGNKVLCSGHLHGQ